MRNPEAYLTTLTAQAEQRSLDLVRMFRSLVRPPAVRLHPA